MISLKESAKSVIKTLEPIPIEWDRFTGGDDEMFVYGWIKRKDCQRDFVAIILLSMQSGNNYVNFTTSSAKYSKQICELLFGESDGHADCIKIENLNQ